MSGPSFVIVLPARYGSTRFPGKPLADINGRPLIEWVWLRAREVRGASDVIIATDDDRIAACAHTFGARVVITRADHATGTDRVAEVAGSLDCDIVVNLQGDEPIFDPAAVEAMVTRLASSGSRVGIATACHPILEPGERENPNVVKVVLASNGEALYFSRAPIPAGDGQAMRHVGIYAFRRDTLLQFSTLPRTPLEMSERLEQLRAMENGIGIAVVVTRKATHGVDVPEDIKIVARELSGTVD